MKKLFSAVVIVLSIFLLYSCNQAPPVSSDIDQGNNTGSSLAKVNFPEAGYFLVQYSSNEKDFSNAVKKSGGVVDVIHPEIKVAKVSGLTNKTAAMLEKKTGIKSVSP